MATRIELVHGSGRWYRVAVDGKWVYGVTVDWDIPGKYYVTVRDVGQREWVRVGPTFVDLEEAAAYAVALMRFN